MKPQKPILWVPEVSDKPKEPLYASTPNLSLLTEETMLLDTIIQDVQTAEKPIVKMLRQGKDFQVLAKASNNLHTLSVDHEGENTVLVRKGEELQLLAISFKKDMVLPKHLSKVPARLVVLKGNVMYSNAIGSINLGLYEEHEIPVEEPHWVEATEDSLILVIKG